MINEEKGGKLSIKELRLQFHKRFSLSIWTCSEREAAWAGYLKAYIELGRIDGK